MNEPTEPSTPCPACQTAYLPYYVYAVGDMKGKCTTCKGRGRVLKGTEHNAGPTDSRLQEPNLKPKQTLREQVAEFHAAMNQKDPTTPTVPSDDRVRLRAKLIAEEFFESLEAMFDYVSQEGGLDLRHARDIVLRTCQKAPILVNMSELADGMADLNYVVCGTELEFGIDGGPIAAEVHRANMAKFIGEPVWSEPTTPGGARKRLKPAGWTPPDIAGELRKQGWKG